MTPSTIARILRSDSPPAVEPNDPDLIYPMHREDHDIVNALGEPIAQAKTEIVGDVIVDAMNAVAI